MIHPISPMPLRAWVNRVLTRNLSGVVLKPTPAFGSSLPADMALRMVTAPQDGSLLPSQTLCAWFQDPATWPTGRLHIIEIPLDVFMAFTVVGHAGEDPAVYDGDQILINGTAYGLPPQTWAVVTGVVEGDAAPFPIRALAEGRGIQVRAEEITGVRRQCQICDAEPLIRDDLQARASWHQAGHPRPA